MRNTSIETFDFFSSDERKKEGKIDQSYNFLFFSKLQHEGKKIFLKYKNTKI